MMSALHGITQFFSLIKRKLWQKTSLSHYYLSSLIYSAVILHFLIPDLYSQGAENVYLWICKALFALAITLMNCFIWLIFSLLAQRHKAIRSHLLFVLSHALGMLFFATSLLHFYAFQEHWNLFSISNAYTGMMAGQAPINLSTSRIILAVAIFSISCSLLLIACKLLLPQRLVLKEINATQHAAIITFCLLLVASAQFCIPSTDASNTINELSPIATLIKKNPRYNSEDFQLHTLGSQEPTRISDVEQLSRIQASDLQTTKASTQPNILFIHIEGFRADMLTPNITPKLYQFAQNNTHLKNHYSSSNNTPTSTFSLLSGLSGEYFQEFRINPSKLIPIQLLKNAGYTFNVFHGASLHYEGLHKLVYSEFTQQRSHGNDYTKTDPSNIQSYLDSLKIPVQGSRFDYLVMDSSHFPYHFPHSHEKFKPALADNFDISSSNFSHLDDKKIEIKNRYKNALHFVDSLLGDLLKTLKESTQLDNTIVVIFGDHGEEFWERNRFGHSFSLNNEQTKVAGIIALPKTSKHTIDYTYTSHQDFMPTILSYMGIHQFTHLYNGKDLLNFNPALNYAKIAMGVVAKAKRYKYAIVGKGKKVTYSLKNELDIHIISDDKDGATEDWSTEEIRQLIMTSEARTLSNQAKNFH